MNRLESRSQPSFLVLFLGGCEADLTSFSRKTYSYECPEPTVGRTLRTRAFFSASCIHLIRMEKKSNHQHESDSGIRVLKEKYFTKARFSGGGF